MRAPLFALLCLAAACSSPQGAEKRQERAPEQPLLVLRYAFAEPLPQLSAEEQHDALMGALEVLRRRVDAAGLDGTGVSMRLTADTIVVELPATDEARSQRITSLLRRSGTLEFKKIESDSLFMKELCQSVREDSKAGVLRIETAQDLWQGPGGSMHKDCYLTATDRSAMLTRGEAEVEGCTFTGDQERAPCIVSGRAILERYLEGRADLELDDAHEIVYELNESSGIAGAPGERYWRTYYQLREAALSGAMIREARVQTNSFDNRPEIRVDFDERGKAALAQLSEANIGNKLSILIDGRVQSAPVVHSAIPGGSVVITLGAVSDQELASRAEDLAALLRSGALPAPLQLVDEQIIPAGQ